MKAITAMALGGALLLTAAPAAEASSAPAASRMTLTVRTSQTTTTVVLTCDPDGGTHPRARDACDSLRAVDGDITRLVPSTGSICLAVYDPHVTTATGVWQGRRRFHIQRTFVNRCQMIVSGGAVYDFTP